MRILLLAALVPALAPAPVGAGPSYHPPAAIHVACDPSPLTGGSRVHLELFARKRAAIVPAAIGLRAPRFERGRVQGAGCRALIWTMDSSGVVDFQGAATLGSFFVVWGQRLAPARLLGFAGPVRLFRNGVRVPGDPRLVPLKNGDELVLEVGGYVPPQRSCRFPR
ncbi:MAG: hypothetical protein ACYDCH_10330 [Gaiellaceae bacterium]